MPLPVPNARARPRRRITALHAIYAYFAGTVGLSSRQHGFEFRWGHHSLAVKTWRSAQRSAAVVAFAAALRPVATRSISPEISLDKSGRPKKIEAFFDVGTWRAASTALPKAGNVRSVPHPAPRCGPSDTVTIMLAVRHQRCEGSSAWTIRSGRSRRSCRSMMRTRRQATTHARTEVAPSRRNA